MVNWNMYDIEIMGNVDIFCLQCLIIMLWLICSHLPLAIPPGGDGKIKKSPESFAHPPGYPCSPPSSCILTLHVLAS